VQLAVVALRNGANAEHPLKRRAVELQTQLGK